MPPEVNETKTTSLSSEAQNEIDVLQAEIDSLKKSLPRAKKFWIATTVLSIVSGVVAFLTLVFSIIPILYGLVLCAAMGIAGFVLKRVGGDKGKIEAKITVLGNKITAIKRKTGGDALAVQITEDGEKAPLSPAVRKIYTLYRYLPCIIAAVFAVCVFIGMALPLSAESSFSLYGMLKTLFTEGFGSLFHFSGVPSFSSIFRRMLNPLAFILLTLLSVSMPLSCLYSWKKKSPSAAKKTDTGNYTTYGFGIFFACCYFYVYHADGTRAGAFPILLLVASALALAGTITAITLRGKFEKKNNIIEEI